MTDFKPILNKNVLARAAKMIKRQREGSIISVTAPFKFDLEVVDYRSRMMPWEQQSQNEFRIQTYMSIDDLQVRTDSTYHMMDLPKKEFIKFGARDAMRELIESFLIKGVDNGTIK